MCTVEGEVDLGGMVLRLGEVVRTLEERVRRCWEGLVREGEVLLVGGDPAFLSWDWALKI